MIGDAKIAALDFGPTVLRKHHGESVHIPECPYFLCICAELYGLNLGLLLGKGAFFAYPSYGGR